jgi:hypothetical protein
LTVRREKTRCWEAWYWQYGKRKDLMLGSLVLAVWKEKVDAEKHGIGSTERKKLDAGKIGTGSSERKN